MNKAEKQCFTLAETLISLTILGVIAVITVTSLIKYQTEKETVTKVFKAYSVLQDAYGRMAAELNNDFSQIELAPCIPNWGCAPIGFLNYLNTDKICTSGAGDCFANTYIVSLDGSTDWYGYKSKHYASAKLHDGMSISVSNGAVTNGTLVCDVGDNKDLCFVIYVDINGKDKGENKLGYDIFSFQFGKNGIYPGSTLAKNDNKCSLSIKSVHNGQGCTNWIIKNRNLKYLHDKSLGYK